MRYRNLASTIRTLLEQSVSKSTVPIMNAEGEVIEDEGSDGEVDGSSENLRLKTHDDTGNRAENEIARSMVRQNKQIKIDRV